MKTPLVSSSLSNCVPINYYQHNSFSAKKKKNPSWIQCYVTFQIHYKISASSEEGEAVQHCIVAMATRSDHVKSIDASAHRKTYECLLQHWPRFIFEANSEGVWIYRTSLGKYINNRSKIWSRFLFLGFADNFLQLWQSQKSKKQFQKFLDSWCDDCICQFCWKLENICYLWNKMPLALGQLLKNPYKNPYIFIGR